jgi:DnaJ-domain-containing protein 1
VAASLLYHVVAAGGVSAEEAMRQVRRGSGIAAPVTRGIDVGNWAESFARNSSEKQRHELLETAVRLVAARSPIPLRQYAALLDLSFGLGFHTDALAKLRRLYGFDYIDHAKEARPREADRSGGGAPLFERETRSREELLRILGMSGNPTRQEVSAAYRKLAAQHHPDRYHGAASEVQSDAAARFIEIARAYEELSRE